MENHEEKCKNTISQDWQQRVCWRVWAQLTERGCRAAAGAARWYRTRAKTLTGESVYLTLPNENVPKKNDKYPFVRPKRSPASFGRFAFSTPEYYLCIRFRIESSAIARPASRSSSKRHRIEWPNLQFPPLVVIFLLKILTRSFPSIRYIFSWNRKLPVARSIESVAQFSQGPSFVTFGIYPYGKLQIMCASLIRKRFFFGLFACRNVGLAVAGRRARERNPIAHLQWKLTMQLQNDRKENFGRGKGSARCRRVLWAFAAREECETVFACLMFGSWVNGSKMANGDSRINYFDYQTNT